MEPLLEASVEIAVVQAVVAKHFGVSVDDLRSRRRTRTLQVPRVIAVYLSDQLCGQNRIRIGEAFDGRDHTIVADYCRKIEWMQRNDPVMRALLEELVAAAKSNA